MAAVTPTARGTLGHVGKGIFGGDGTTTDNRKDAGTHFPDRSGMQLSIYHFTDIDNAETWTSGIMNAYSVAWQCEDAADDAVALVLLSSATAQNARGRIGAEVGFQSQTSASGGWVWVFLLLGSFVVMGMRTMATPNAGQAAA